MLAASFFSWFLLLPVRSLSIREVCDLFRTCFITSALTKGRRKGRFTALLSAVLFVRTDLVASAETLQVMLIWYSCSKPSQTSTGIQDVETVVKDEGLQQLCSPCIEARLGLRSEQAG